MVWTFWFCTHPEDTGDACAGSQSHAGRSGARLSSARFPSIHCRQLKSGLCLNKLYASVRPHHSGCFVTICLFSTYKALNWLPITHGHGKISNYRQALCLWRPDIVSGVPWFPNLCQPLYIHKHFTSHFLSSYLPVRSSVQRPHPLRDSRVIESRNLFPRGPSRGTENLVCCIL